MDLIKRELLGTIGIKRETPTGGADDVATDVDVNVNILLILVILVIKVVVNMLMMLVVYMVDSPLPEPFTPLKIKRRKIEKKAILYLIDF
uniref:Uncharacterized protein n=1 Tax=Solanum tuberosum TaxID=4113 RepID=M1A8D8_SOLTU